MHILLMMTQFQTFSETYFDGIYTYAGVHTVNREQLKHMGSDQNALKLISFGAACQKCKLA